MLCQLIFSSLRDFVFYPIFLSNIFRNTMPGRFFERLKLVFLSSQVSNNTKLNISYSRLMRKSYDRVQYRAANETWSLPWHDQLFYTMAPEMNYVPLLGTMEPQQGRGNYNSHYCLLMEFTHLHLGRMTSTTAHLIPAGEHFRIHR